MKLQTAIRWVWNTRRPGCLPAISLGLGGGFVGNTEAPGFANTLAERQAMTSGRADSLTANDVIAAEPPPNVEFSGSRGLIAACETILVGDVDVRDAGIRRTNNASFIWAKWGWLIASGYGVKTIQPKRL